MTYFCYTQSKENIPMQTNTKSPGGLLVGETDKNGGPGIKVVAPEGNILMGGGELILTSDTGKSTDLHEFDGKKMTPCEIASELNVNGGGVKIPCHIAEPANTTDSKMEVGDVIKKESGGNIGNDNLTELKNALSKYGWTVKISEDGKSYQLINRNNKIVSDVKFKGSRYFFYDTIGNKLLSGMGELGKSAERVATGYFYANLIGESETIKSTNKEKGGAVDHIISKYNLWGKGIPVRFINDHKTYFTKNIASDRNRIFVADANGNVFPKKIADLEYVQTMKVEFENARSMEAGGRTKNERYKISYLDKKRNFQQTDKFFEGENAYENAAKWGRANLENFHSDMIAYIPSTGRPAATGGVELHTGRKENFKTMRGQDGKLFIKVGNIEYRIDDAVLYTKKYQHGYEKRRAFVAVDPKSGHIGITYTVEGAGGRDTRFVMPEWDKEVKPYSEATKYEREHLTQGYSGGGSMEAGGTMKIGMKGSVLDALEDAGYVFDPNELSAYFRSSEGYREYDNIKKLVAENKINEAASILKNHIKISLDSSMATGGETDGYKVGNLIRYKHWYPATFENNYKRFSSISTGIIKRIAFSGDYVIQNNTGSMHEEIVKKEDILGMANGSSIESGGKINMKIFPDNWDLVQEYDGNFIFEDDTKTFMIAIELTEQDEPPYSIGFIQLKGDRTKIGFESGAYATHAETEVGAIRKAVEMAKFINEKNVFEEMAKGGKTQLQIGMDVEKEHRDLYLRVKKMFEANGMNMPISENQFYATIAKAHIREDKHYYDKLLKYVEGEKKEKGGMTKQAEIDNSHLTFDDYRPLLQSGKMPSDFTDLLMPKKKPVIDQVLYHGTNRQFKGKLKPGQEINNPTYGTEDEKFADNSLGIFFTDNKTMAQWFAGGKEYDGDKDKYISTGNGNARVIEKRVVMHNPYIIDQSHPDYDADNDQDSAAIYFDEIEKAGGAKQYKKDLLDKGYDGIVLRGNTKNYYGDGTYDMFVSFAKSLEEGGKISDKEKNEFIEYVIGFYGEGEIYSKWFPNMGRKAGASKEEVENAINKYVNSDFTDNYSWGGGDSLDRERVRDIMFKERGILSSGGSMEAVGNILKINTWQVYYMDNDSRKKILKENLFYHQAVKMSQEKQSKGLSADYEPMPK